MVDIPGNSTTTATIGVGGSLSNSLEVIGDHDWFRITLSQGQSISIALTSDDFDCYLRVRDAAGNLLYENDDSGGSLDSRVAFTASASGTYYIDVGSFEDAEAGGYQLAVENYTPPPVGTIDQFADFLASGYWGGDPHHFAVSQSGSLTVNLVSLTAEGRIFAREALKLWSDVIGVQFVEVTIGGQITFDDNEEDAFSDAVWSGGITQSAHVNVSTAWLNDYRGDGLDSYAFLSYVHEIGHALGLGHAGDYNFEASYPYDAVYQNDGWPISVMSYFDQIDSTYYADRDFSQVHVVTPMLADVQAMAQLYGLSTTTRTGDTVYGFNSTAGRDVFNAAVYSNVAYTIVDSGGTDTLNYSGFSANQMIDLHTETFSNVGGLVGNVSIARGVIIENAIGGSGNDALIGNSANNVLIGGAGNDSIAGSDGDDILVGGAGDDTLNGGLGTDTASYANASSGVTVTLGATGSGGINMNGVPQSTGGAGTDTLTSIENLIGSDFNDTLKGVAFPTAGFIGSVLDGREGDDWLLGSTGWDTLIGGSGWDAMQGGYGSDLYIIAAATDHTSTEISDFGFDVESDEVRFTATTASTLTLFDGDTGIERIVIGTGTGTTADVTGLTALNVDASALNNGVFMLGNSGANTLIATDFADQLHGGQGNDQLYGNAGDDYIDGFTGADMMYGGAGDDLYLVDNISDAAIEMAGEGTDLVSASATHTLSAEVENLSLTGIANLNGTGNALGNVLTGNDGLNRLYGLGGNDTLDGGAGEDKLYGGAGDDTFIVGSGGDATIEVAGEGTDLVQSSVTHTLKANIENLTLTGIAALNGIGNGLANVLTGNNAANRLDGLAGDDQLVGNGGGDTLDGGLGDDVMAGGVGNDSYVIDSDGDDTLENAGEGTDNVKASVSHTLRANIENLTLTGTALTGTGNELANIINGNALANILAGGLGADRLYGLAGNDTLHGGVGDDKLYGGLGDDIYIVDDGDATVELAGEGTDLVNASISHILKANIENLALTGSASLTGTGNALGNVLTGNGGVNRLYGLDGADTLDGGVGEDKLYGGTGDDIYVVDSNDDATVELAGEGSDLVQSSVTHALKANIENLELTGSANLNGTGNGLDNRINGNSGDNVLSGLAGNDTLDGGGGRDTMHGGTGADIFAFDEADFAGLTTATCDVIGDFSQAGGDTIHLNDVDANSGTDGDQAFAFIGGVAFSNVAGELRYEQIDGNTYVQGDTNGDSLADFMIRLDGLHTLQSADLWL